MERCLIPSNSRRICPWTGECAVTVVGVHVTRLLDRRLPHFGPRHSWSLSLCGTATQHTIPAPQPWVFVMGPRQLFIIVACLLVWALSWVCSTAGLLRFCPGVLSCFGSCAGLWCSLWFRVVHHCTRLRSAIYDLYYPQNNFLSCYLWQRNLIHIF